MCGKCDFVGATCYGQAGATHHSDGWHCNVCYVPTTLPADLASSIACAFVPAVSLPSATVCTSCCLGLAVLSAFLCLLALLDLGALGLTALAALTVLG